MFEIHNLKYSLWKEITIDSKWCIDFPKERKEHLPILSFLSVSKFGDNYPIVDIIDTDLKEKYEKDSQQVNTESDNFYKFYPLVREWSKINLQRTLQNSDPTVLETLSQWSKVTLERWVFGITIVTQQLKKLFDKSLPMKQDLIPPELL